ncbi:hypothetical protein ACFQ1M_07715 [Sungkyunkwania multivorans]|uniref:Lipoprotein n=1 Tax=Sungkyunkwania multivorans TaxID=1173618 RepID=A0ABW3CWE3_9FLAO
MMRTTRAYNIYFTMNMALFLMSCVNTRNTVIKNKTEDMSSGSRTVIISAPIVYKSAIRKHVTDDQFKEMYVRRSIQDYYIKFCESAVSRKQLEHHIRDKDGLIKAVRIEIEYRDGDWDICEKEDRSQGRVGTYVVVHRIME